MTMTMTPAAAAAAEQQQQAGNPPATPLATPRVTRVDLARPAVESTLQHQLRLRVRLAFTMRSQEGVLPLALQHQMIMQQTIMAVTAIATAMQAAAAVGKELSTRAVPLALALANLTPTPVGVAVLATARGIRTPPTATATATGYC